MNREQRYPGKANNDRQTLKYPSEICEPWTLLKADTRKDESHQHSEASKD